MSQIFTIQGYFLHNPNSIYYMNVSLDSWNGIEDHVDNDIFFYMDGEPLKKGQIIAENFYVQSIE